MKSKISVALGLVLALSATLAQAAGNPVAGRDKASTCMGCHGAPSYVNTYPTYHVPYLGGQHAEYLVSALKAYRSGERQHGTMNAQGNTLTDQDIEDIAVFLSHAPQHK